MGHVLDVFAGFTQSAATRRVFSAGGSGAPTSRGRRRLQNVGGGGVRWHQQALWRCKRESWDTAARVRRCKDIHEEGPRPLAGWQQLNLMRPTT